MTVGVRMRHNLNMNPFEEWQQRYPQAAADLLRVIEYLPGARDSEPTGLESEAGVQSALRLNAAKRGIWTARNNNGMFINPHGVPVRFGLANDSKRLNTMLKSSDVIGCEPLLVTHDLVGKIIGRFWARECKEPGWHYTGTPREKGQLNFINLINSLGGNAQFANTPDTL